MLPCLILPQLVHSGFLYKIQTKCPEKELVKVGRIATVVVVVLGILWIPVMKGLGKVSMHTCRMFSHLLAPGIAAVFLLGIASRKTTPMAGLVGLISGFVLGMLRLGLKIFAGGINHEG